MRLSIQRLDFDFTRIVKRSLQQCTDESKTSFCLVEFFFHSPPLAVFIDFKSLLVLSLSIDTYANVVVDGSAQLYPLGSLGGGHFAMDHLKRKSIYLSAEGGVDFLTHVTIYIFSRVNVTEVDILHG